MHWVTANFKPGFSRDPTSWEVRIERDGALCQTVGVRVLRIKPGASRAEDRTEQFTAHLSPGQLTELQRLIAETDFAAVSAASRTFSLLDVARSTITVQDTPEVLHFDAPLEAWAYLQPEGHLPQLDLGPALRLWRAIEAYCPYGSHRGRA